MEWFLINQNEHLGPFDEQIIHDLFNEGEISKESLVWREGWTDAKTYEDVFLLSEEDKVFKPLNENLESLYDKEPEGNIIKDDELPPDLPNEVVDFKKKVASIKSAVVHKEPEPKIKDQVVVTERGPVEVVHEEEYEYELEELNKSKKQKSLVNDKEATVKQMEESEEELDIADVFEYDYDVASEEKKLHKIFRQLFIAVLSLIIIAPIILYITNSEEVFSRPRTMSLEDYERLTTTANDESKDLKFSFSLATDKRTLWLSTNISLEGEVFVNLKSKRNRTLGGLVEVKAKGILEKRLITLTEFQFIQGTKFVDGYYDAELYTVNDLKEPFYNRFFEPREKQFRYLNDVLITSLHVAEFEKLLEKKNQAKMANQSRFWEDLVQEYKTVRGITDNIKTSIETVFGSPKEDWLKAVEGFDNAYKNNFGIFFTSFILNVDKQYDSLMLKQFPNKNKIISHYAKLKELAIEIGKESVSVLENLKSAEVMNMTTEQFQDLKYNSLLKFKLIIQECDDMVDKI